MTSSHRAKADRPLCQGAQVTGVDLSGGQGDFWGSEHPSEGWR